jgi:hypothetical protein
MLYSVRLRKVTKLLKISISLVKLINMAARLKLKTNRSMKTITRWKRIKKTLSRRNITMKMESSNGRLKKTLVVTHLHLKLRKMLLNGSIKMNLNYHLTKESKLRSLKRKTRLLIWKSFLKTKKMEFGVYLKSLRMSSLNQMKLK